MLDKWREMVRFLVNILFKRMLPFFKSKETIWTSDKAHRTPLRHLRARHFQISTAVWMWMPRASFPKIWEITKTLSKNRYRYQSLFLEFSTQMSREEVVRWEETRSIHKTPWNRSSGKLIWNKKSTTKFPSRVNRHLIYKLIKPTSLQNLIIYKTKVNQLTLKSHKW